MVNLEDFFPNNKQQEENDNDGSETSSSITNDDQIAEVKIDQQTNAVVWRG